MKCNQCGSDNAANAKFCANCGSSLAAATPTAASASSPSGPTASATSAAPFAPATPAGPIASGFNNLNAFPAQKNPAHTILIIECVIGLLVLAVIVGIFLWFILGRGKTEVLSCKQETPAVTSSEAYTYKNGEVIKAETTYIWDKTVEDDESAFGVAMMIMMKDELEAKYADQPGVKYRIDDGDYIATISAEINLEEASGDIKAETEEDVKELGNLEDAKKSLEAEGYVCTVK